MVMQSNSLSKIPPTPELPTDVLFKPFPKQEEFINAALDGRYNFILYGGAIRGGKTFAMLALFILLCRLYPGSRWAIVRKDLPTLKRNTFPSWDKIKPDNFIKVDNSDSNQQTVTFTNGSKIIFFPESYSTDKDQNRWRGLEVNGIGFEEINECQEASFGKAFERAGTYIIKDAPVQPKPLVVGTCNPTQGWVKQRIYDPWEKNELPEGWLYIQSRIYDNIPLLTQQPSYLPALKASLSHYELEVFVEGNWNVQLKTGGEFLKDFELSKHVKPLKYVPGIPVCISLDSNVYPYIAITAWQLIRNGTGWIIRQIDELPAIDPENSASEAGQKIVTFLKSIGTKERVYLHGDYSLKSRNTIDPKKRSFFEIVHEQIRNAGFRTEDKCRPHVSVASLGDFINSILRNEVNLLSIEIGENCRLSINDYIESKKDKDGAILKVIVRATQKMPAHQRNGHLLDTMKDFIAQSFPDELDDFLSTDSNEELLEGIGYFA